MTTMEVKVIRDRTKEDGEVVRWRFAWVPGLEAFGRVMASGLVEVVGRDAGRVVMDWLRDRDIEPVIAR